MDLPLVVPWNVSLAAEKVHSANKEKHHIYALKNNIDS